MQKKEIKGFIFDLGGVIFKDDGVSYEGREKLSEELGIDKEKFHRFWFDRKDKMTTGKLSEDEYLREFIKLYNLKISLKDLKRSIRSKNKIDEEMIKFILFLKEKYRLFALTNDVKEWIEYRIERFSLNRYFEKIISSSDVGFAKPEKEIYEIMIEETGIASKNLVFVDNREENLLPAERLGMLTYYFKDGKSFERWLKEKKLII